MRVLLAGLALGVALVGGEASAAKLDKPAPPFIVYTVDHQKLTAADLRGKVVVLNYWATWCGPCRAEMMAFDNYLKAHPNSDLKVYVIESDHNLSIFELRKIAAAAHFEVAERLSGGGYGVIGGGVPTSYVIDRAGVIRHAAAGAFDEQSFNATVAPLLAERPPQAAVMAQSVGQAGG